MKAINIQYMDYGDSILLSKKDWRKVTKFLTEHGATVTENFTLRVLSEMKKIEKRKKTTNERKMK